MTNVLPFQARPVSPSSVHEAEAQTSRTPEAPVLRMYFKTPDGRIARSTLHTTLEIDFTTLDKNTLKQIEALHAQILTLLGSSHLTMHVMNVLRVEAAPPRVSTGLGGTQHSTRAWS